MKNKTVAESPIKKSKPRREWSKRIESDGITKSINVEELDNGGYLVKTNIYGTSSKGKYIDETGKYYAESNPLEGEDSASIKELTNSLMNNKTSLLT